MAKPLWMPVLFLLCACTRTEAMNEEPRDSSAGGEGGEAGSSGGTGGREAGAGAGGSLSAPSPAGLFPAGSPWTRDVRQAPKDPKSDEIITWLDGMGFGLGRMQIDFSLTLLQADARTPRRSFTKTDDFFTPDCDHVPVPLPQDGALEGESGYACENDGDCHLLVWEEDERKLYEMWRADVRGESFRGGCLAVWDLTRVYPPEGRGDQCTSADAAGFPIAPLLFTADEVAKGEIPHALRFILPNARIRAGEYVRPATHGTRATTGPASAPPYGVRLRLRADFPLQSLPNEGARTVARALQTYGMLLADGGNITLTAASDRHTQAKWNGLLAARDLQTIKPRDFEVVQMGPAIPLTLQCER